MSPRPPAGPRQGPATRPTAKPGGTPTAKPGATPTAKPGATPVSGPARRTAPSPRPQPAAKVARESVRESVRESPRVSPTSAERFARRVLWRRRKRALGVLATLVVLAAAAWLLLGSAWLRVQHVVVSGTVRLDPAQVHAQADALVGQPMLLVDGTSVRDAVQQEQVVRSVRVERAWPSTLRVVVTERLPVAAVPAGSGLRLVDGDGIVVETTQTPPSGLPIVEVDLVGEDAGPTLRAALTVLDALPRDLRSSVRTIGADSPDDVWFVRSDRSRVQWGSAERSDLKVAVLQALLPRKARLYDVSAPEAPAVRGTR